MCDAKIRDGSLTCTRTDDHLTGHTFEASWCADGHDVSEAMDE